MVRDLLVKCKANKMAGAEPLTEDGSPPHREAQKNSKAQDVG